MQRLKRAPSEPMIPSEISASSIGSSLQVEQASSAEFCAGMAKGYRNQPSMRWLLL